MPIYEYQCEKCGVFDVMQKITDKPLRKCPTCKAKVAKLLSNTAFHLKGSGWYVTDYARKSSDKGPSESKSSEPNASETKVEKSSDSSSSSSGSSDTKTTKAKKSKSDSSKAANAA